jgi:hypothetical protein
MNKSKIKKSIFRKISTAKYETIDINLEIEEEIEWKDMKERMAKTEKISQILILDFINTYDKVIGELKIDRKIASGTKIIKDNEQNDSLDYLDK